MGSTSGKRWYHNPTDNSQGLFKEGSQPDGWVKGQSPISRQAKSKISKELWKDPNYGCNKDRESYISKRKDSLKETWKDSQKRRIHGKAVNQGKTSEEISERSKSGASALWSKEGSREHMSQVVKSMWGDESKRAQRVQAMSLAAKKSLEDPSIRDQKISRLVNYNKGSESREAHRLSLLEQWRTGTGVASEDSISKRLYTSSMEDDIREFVKSLGVEVSKPHILDIKDGGAKKEIDIYVKELHLGIEVNGLYWHSTKMKPWTYHRDKYLAARELGIHLVQIWEDHWLENKSKIENYLRELITKYKTKYAARNLYVGYVLPSEAQKFYSDYHLQGANKLYKINYGLYKDNMLVSCMSFHPLRRKGTFGSNFMELTRYCVLPETTVIGGAKRLFSKFLKEYPDKGVLSYSDNDYFTGDIYESLGFYKDTIFDNYSWVIKDVVYPREQCQLQYLEERYPGVLEKASEWKSNNDNKGNREVYICENLLKGYCINRAGRTRWVYNQEFV